MVGCSSFPARGSHCIPSTSSAPASLLLPTVLFFHRCLGILVTTNLTARGFASRNSVAASFQVLAVTARAPEQSCDSSSLISQRTVHCHTNPSVLGHCGITQKGIASASGLYLERTSKHLVAMANLLALPTEISCVIFRALNGSELKKTLVVSSLWRSIARPISYEDAVVDFRLTRIVAMLPSGALLTLNHRQT